VSPSAIQPAAGLPNDDEQLLRSLIVRIRARDEQALASLYDLTLGRVYGLVLRVVRQPADAEEVVGDLYMHVWEKAADYAPERGAVMAWLQTQAWSRAVDRLRRVRRRSQEVSLHPEEGEAAYRECEGLGVEQIAEACYASQGIRQAFKSLTDAQQNILQLAFFEDMSHQEISDRTGIPLGTVKSHARRGLAALRAVLGDEGRELSA
jgi:RNA polymerase sigma-70 factor (ECF subfamily)